MTREWFVDIDATLKEAKKNAKQKKLLEESIPMLRECRGAHSLDDDGSSANSCDIGPVAMMSIALDREEDSMEEKVAKPRGRQSFLSVPRERSNTRSRSASSIRGQ